ncbi:uroporphyrinogen-III C-methyltransferase [Geovibrio thiophilus]|uniref:uroporphyrinogen-III C-methyltransferase n=1 Tax=Geovibrio thiophilus TaxID=139438 RepID=A0A3R6AYF8_9BACT|nr:uroporphyrinogen-III C-methyltransferase [Geovibrio thiophilus]QAR33432.1 uroporphyrinogen-III C-methyltransferase [Geovibrio thiophilus]
MSKKLIIVGAGLNRGSMTLAGADALKTADVVLYDRLIDKAVLEYAACPCIDVGKHPYDKNCVLQRDINGIIAEHLAENKIVVRLKGGDSSVFARTAEEVETARAAGADVEVIAGVTSASALSAKLRSALTDRRNIPGVVFITGHTKEGTLDNAYNWEALAGLGFTIVVYMGVKNLGDIAGRLMEHGMEPSVPVLIGESIETAEERIMFTVLGEAGRFVDENAVKHPATIIIGEIVNHAG